LKAKKLKLVKFALMSLQVCKPESAEKECNMKTDDLKPLELQALGHAAEDIVPDPTLAALTGPPIHEQLVAIGDDIVQKQAEVPEHCASEPNVVENIDATPEKPVLLKHAMKQGVKRFAEKADELTPAGKSDKKTKKNMPEGCGGVTAKALSCVICERPREMDQRGQACPTCQNIMRSSHKIRSIPLVLKDDTLKQTIAVQSLKQKPSRESKERQNICRKLADMEKMLQDLQSSWGK